MKVVFDTNVYIAEALGGDTATRLFASTDRASWRTFVSRHIVEEMTAVMTDDLALSRRSAALAAIPERPSLADTPWSHPLRLGTQCLRTPLIARCCARHCKPGLTI